MEDADDYNSEPCPSCGKRTLVDGYGLAFGRGVGAYTACDSCDYVSKGLDPDLYTAEEIAAGGEPGPICNFGDASGHGGES